MKIGIIGAGLIGGSLARHWVKLGHEVLISNSRGPETLRELAAETGAKAVTFTDAVKGVDVVVVSIPQKAIRDLPKGLFANVPKEVVVIDTGNYYPVRDGRIPELDGGTPESEWVAAQLGRPVVKVFNNIGFASLREKTAPRGTPGRVALPVAGDPPEARAKVLQFVDELGFDAVDAGGTAESWRQQPGTPAYGQDFDAARLKQALAATDRSKLPQYRQAADEGLKQYLASLQKS
ncbi:NADP oxidoreductase [Corallococcus llansteffanensis]|uniref:NADP oxidoreductase n=1 Tax=Corallococcus llansteffanensis TaxID=2316731 RepID=A0A3A8PKY5_9BACT|nr:NADP oxidoreductase [Corallococcus llansteffanensis]